MPLTFPDYMKRIPVIVILVNILSTIIIIIIIIGFGGLMIWADPELGVIKID